MNVDNLASEVGMDAGGWYVLWNGYVGVDLWETRWYTTDRFAAEKLAQGPPPIGARWRRYEPRADPFDLACERRHD